MIAAADLAQTHQAAFTMERPWSLAEFATLIESTGVITAGQKASFAMGRIILDECEVLTVATHPDHQGQGLARTAMTTLITQAQAQGVTQFFLEVAADNTPAQRLYSALGFVKIGQRRGYYKRKNAPAQDAIIMGLACNSS